MKHRRRFSQLNKSLRISLTGRIRLHAQLMTTTVRLRQRDKTMNQHFSPNAVDASAVAMESELEAAISRWRLAQHPVLPHSEAIYQLLAIALRHEGFRPGDAPRAAKVESDPVARLLAALKDIH